jgi:hypothetical protein
MTRFWVGGSGTWDASDTTHWSATSGGAGGASAPTSAVDAVFDAAGGGGTVTVDSGAGLVNCKSLTVSAVYTIEAAGFDSIQIYGDYTVTAAATVSLRINAEASVAMTISGAPELGAYVQESGTLTFNGDPNYSGSISISGPSPAADAGANASITIAGDFVLSGPVNMRAAAWDVGRFRVGTLAVVTQGTATITVHSGFDTGGVTWDIPVTFDFNTDVDCYFGDGDDTTFNAAVTITTANFDAPVTLNFYEPATYTFNAGLTIDSGAGRELTLQTYTPGTPVTLSKASGEVSINNAVIVDSVASGGATFTAYDSTDGGGNTGWLFAASARSFPLFFGAFP